MQALISYALKISLSKSLIRTMSQSTSIPKKQVRIRDHGYDDYMEVEKKMRKVLQFQELILSQPNKMISTSRLDSLSRRIGFKQLEAGRFILKFPHVFEVFEHPVQRILYCRLTLKAISQIQWESEALLNQVPEAVTRVRKLLMMSNTGRIRLEHVRIARKEFGLPDDFEYSVILKYPEYFRLFDAEETRNKYIGMVERDESLGVSEIEKAREREYREKGADAEDVRFSFIVNFPPGFKIGKYYKIAVWKWQRLPYWSPYEDVSGYDLRSLEAQNRMEKRAVAMIHELLTLTVEKKITLERIAHFRMALDLPKKLKEFLLQHQGIFYISTRGNQGKLHTVFLREAYKKGELVERNELYLARRKLAELVLMSPRKARIDRELIHYRRGREEDDMRGVRRDYMEDDFQIKENGKHGEDLDGVLDVSSSSDYSDEDDRTCVVDDLRANTEYTGYTAASPAIQWFWEVDQGFIKEDKAHLLQFVTGTSKAPLEGFSGLKGISGSQKFQIHEAYSTGVHLPSAHTCFNQLDLPEYPLKRRLEDRLLLAIHEANEGFIFG